VSATPIRRGNAGGDGDAMKPAICVRLYKRFTIAGCNYVGDQVLEWDGSSLQDATFEEARDIMSRSGDTVQVVLMHCRYVLYTCKNVSYTCKTSIKPLESYSFQKRFSQRFLK